MYAYYTSPIGTILITASSKGIRSINFVEEQVSNPTPDLPQTISAQKHIEQGLQELEAYFIGQSRTFDLKLDLVGTTFQKQVWNALLEIPFGKKVTYLDIARQVGKPKGSQAVGNANGKNPIAIVVPCHRVIGKNGSLVGYAGGLERKKWLLEFESGSRQGRLF